MYDTIIFLAPQITVSLLFCFAEPPPHSAVRTFSQPNEYFDSPTADTVFV